MGFFAAILSFISLVLGLLHTVKLRFWAFNSKLITYGLKMIAETFAPVLAVMGIAGAFLGVILKDPVTTVIGAVAAWLSARFMRRVVTHHASFEQCFGPEWEQTLQARTTPEQRSRMLQKRWSWILPEVPAPLLEQDVVYWTLPATTGPDGEQKAERPLLCDLWLPAEGVEPSGTGILYIHGGGWESLDKDTHTRPLFRRLAGQGHTIMDVSYRLCFETDMYGIVADVKRAIAWFKANATRCQVDPERIVLFGASAGGHLAMLAGYTPNHPELDPPDLDHADTSVRAVVSYYGLPDLRRLGLESESTLNNPALEEAAKKFGYVEPEGYLLQPELARRLFGGLPTEVPEVAALMSPITHAGPHCPPTLQLIGTHDHIVSIADIRALDEALKTAGACSVSVELPEVDHAFDLLALDVSPSAQTALYDTERFLALVA
jgi:acetyl esterase/lipase